MSRDQKPGKIKLVSTSGAHAGHPAHPERFDEETGDQNPSSPDQSSISQDARPSMFLTLLFLTGCAIGGSGIALGFNMIG